jgi:hypothetical protein
MAISISTLTAGSDGTPSSVCTTASVSPSANALLLLGITAYNSAGSLDPSTPTVTGNGLTWQLIAQADVDILGTDRSKLYTFRSMGATPSSGAITITFADSNQTKVCWLLDQATGANYSGSNGSGAIAQSTSAVTSSSTTSLSTTFTSSFTSGNVGWAAYHVEDTTAATFTPDTGWTLQSSSVNQNFALIYSQQETTDNAISASWSPTGRAGLVAVEILAQPMTPIPWLRF